MKAEYIITVNTAGTLVPVVTAYRWARYWGCTGIKHPYKLKDGVRMECMADPERLSTWFCSGEGAIRAPGTLRTYTPLNVWRRERFRTRKHRDPVGAVTTHARGA